MKSLFPFLIVASCSFGQFVSNQTPTYPELVGWYQNMDQQHAEIELYAMGESDTEFPIYVCIINGSKDSLKTFQKARTSTTVLINNAIHPGEPDGVNASMQWITDWVSAGKPTKNLPLIAFIPAYNVGGMLNRGSFSRANQLGPEEYGFRGNAQNLDLNRDFIKMDSKNALTFAKIYNALDPDVFVDTHVSNGADYQYTITFIHSVKERLMAPLRQLQEEEYIPAMTKAMKTNNWDWAPYVNTRGETPETGLTAFNDLPRYAQGYASLFHSLSITVETHMLKPFPQRVQATLDYFHFLFDWVGKNSQYIETKRQESLALYAAQPYAKFNFQLNEKQFQLIPFKGFEAGHKPSEVSGQPRLYYDRNRPWEKEISFYHVHDPKDSVLKPKAYIVSREAESVIKRLQLNGVLYHEMVDCSIHGTSIRITDFQNGTKPYEGHFLHRGTASNEQKDSIHVPAGSIYIPLDQPKAQFIVSVLEPRMEDSYFAWNFMDSYVQEKEYFSDYVFEDIAADLIQNNPDLAMELELKKKADPEWSKNTWDLLFFIYQRSPYFEKTTFNRLPVYKIY